MAIDAQASLRPDDSAVVLEAIWRSPNTDILERHLVLEVAIVGRPLTTGNRVLLQDGPAPYQAMFAAIAAAADRINPETCILDDDAVGQRFAAALVARQAQGTQINWL